MIATRYRLARQVAMQQQLSREIARANTDISSQKRLQGPSDDPAAAARIAEIQRNQSDEAVWTQNVSVALAMSDRVETSLDTVGVNLDRAKTLMLQASNGTLNATDRATIAAELRGIAEDLAALAGEKDSRGQPLYATTGERLAYPVGPGVSVAAQAQAAGIFTGIATAGGPKDLSAILADAASAIELPDQAEREAASTLALGELDAARNSVADALGDQGVRSARLTAIADRLDSTKIVAAEERSRLEDTDIEATVIQLQAKMTALQAAQAVLAKISQRTLFDLI